MTPFDPVALVVMLQTFYPIVTRAALERAFRERPEYFAGGTLIGRALDALRLPDGRIFDIVFAAGSAIARWQALDVTTPGPPGPVDPFALEAGPLVPIDIDGILPPAPDHTFEALVGAALVELGATEALVDQALRDLTAGVDDGALDAEYQRTVGTAAATLEGDVVELEHLNITELLEQSEGVERDVDDSQGDFPALPSDAPEIPGVPPGDAPPEEPPPPQV